MRVGKSALLMIVLLSSGTLPVEGQTPPAWTTGSYVYDGAGNIKSIGVDQFRYDALGRLVSATYGAGQVQAVEYDEYGNVRKMTTNGALKTFGVDAATNRVSQNTASVFATYDAAGRITSTLLNADRFEYDALDAVTRSTVDGVTRVHLYTAAGERLASVTVSNGVETRSEWTLRDASGRVLRRLERNGGAWTWKEDYVYGPGQLLAAENDAGETSHFFPDHLGTPRLITDRRGGQVAIHKYWPFGDEFTSPTQDSQKLKFTGHERDAATLDYMHARYYAPKWGRFLSVDPTWKSADLGKPQSWNRDSYVINNPVNLVDPDGRAGTEPGAAGFDRKELAMALYATGAGYITTYVLDAEPTGGDLPKDPAERARYIEQRAKDIHSSLPEATQRRTTTAVAEVTNPDGSKQVLVGSNEKKLRSPQVAALRAGETAVEGAGHAEQTVINAAAASGQKVEGVAASRPICPSCNSAIRQAGAKAWSALKSVVKKVL